MPNATAQSGRGVSEVLGFVLLFSVVLLSIVSVSIFGMNAIQEGRDTVVTDNIQTGFEAMAVTIEDIYQEHAPRRSVTLTAKRGSIQQGNPVSINISVNNMWVANSTFEPIVFELDESRVIYSGTAVIREESGGAAMVRDPAFSINGENIILPVVKTQASGDTVSVGGRTTIDFIHANETINQTTSASNLRVWIEAGSPARAKAWERSLTEMRSWSCSVSGTSVKCSDSWGSGANIRVLVHSVKINYQLST